MQTVPADILSRHPARRRLLTRRDYYRMGEAGILRKEDRVELLQGQLVDMSPIGPRHAIVTGNLEELLFKAFVGRARIRCQLPVALDDGSEPQPDFAVVRNPWLGYPRTHPGPGDVFLLIEVSDSSLEFDRSVKLPLYAGAGIPEVWIVDLTSDAVLVYRGPSGGGYASASRVEAPGVLEVVALPGGMVAVAEVFG